MWGPQAACPKNWDYENHQNSGAIVARRSTTAVRIVRGMNAAQKAALAQDIRPFHELLFTGLTPPHFPYFAGKYRGERFRCLQDYEVGVQGDRAVGHTAATVPMEMESFAVEVGRLNKEMDFSFSANSKLFTPEMKVFRAVQLVAAAFVYFLEIHPFANGNGHSARMLIICLLGRHNIYPNAKWKLHPRPDDPAYTQAIAAYRKGDKSKLHVLLLSCI
ncbi:MAG: hypothetical protein E5V37_26955 [Mesorhizobium sp.]|nr:MAG: hypothetical protein E5V37_26955 [Mesorhizobium sp.]